MRSSPRAPIAARSATCRSSTEALRAMLRAGRPQHWLGLTRKSRWSRCSACQRRSRDAHRSGDARTAPSLHCTPSGSGSRRRRNHRRRPISSLRRRPSRSRPWRLRPARTDRTAFRSTSGRRNSGQRSQARRMRGECTHVTPCSDERAIAVPSSRARAASRPRSQIVVSPLNLSSTGETTPRRRRTCAGQSQGAVARRSVS